MLGLYWDNVKENGSYCSITTMEGLGKQSGEEAAALAVPADEASAASGWSRA